MSNICRANIYLKKEIIDEFKESLNLGKKYLKVITTRVSTGGKVALIFDSLDSEIFLLYSEKDVNNKYFTDLVYLSKVSAFNNFLYRSRATDDEDLAIALNTQPIHKVESFNYGAKKDIDLSIKVIIDNPSIRKEYMDLTFGSYSESKLLNKIVSCDLDNDLELLETTSLILHFLANNVTLNISHIKLFVDRIKYAGFSKEECKKDYIYCSTNLDKKNLESFDDKKKLNNVIYRLFDLITPKGELKLSRDFILEDLDYEILFKN